MPNQHTSIIYYYIEIVKIKLNNLVFRPKRSTLVDEKHKDPNEIVLGKPVSYSIGTISKWLRLMQARLSKRLHWWLPRIPLFALKIEFLGLRLISFLLDLYKEPLILSRWIRIQMDERSYLLYLSQLLPLLFVIHGIQKVIVSGNII